MRKVLAFLISAILPLSALATSETEYSTVDAPYLKLSATLGENNVVNLNWTASEFDKFNGWKVVRSNTNADPIYPEDGYIFYDQTPEANSYIDANAPLGTVYYRVCAITTDSVRYCSSVVSVNIEEASDYQDVVVDDSLSLEVEATDEGLKFTWSPTEYKNFLYWKLIFSKTNSSPSYPEDGYLYYSNYAETNEFIDENSHSGTGYYRLCAITETKERYCSNVIEYNFENGSETVICTMEYSPVCGTDGQTYSNSCVATEQNNVNVDHTGVCTASDLELNYSANTSTGEISLVWQDNTSNNIKYYKVVRSESNTEPTYPEEGYIAVLSPQADQLEYSYTDALLTSGTYYYGITAVLDDDSNLYSNFITVDLELPSPFSDTTDSDFEAAIRYVKNIGLVNGYSDGTYLPNNTINRAEFSKILTKAITDMELSGTRCFSDVSTDWYAPYVCELKNRSIIKGYSDGSFQPAQEINTVEALKIILLAFDISVSEADEGEEWYVPYWDYALGHNLLPSSVTSVDKKITRGEMAEIIYRLKTQN